jgi:hypothetical protein
MKLQHPSEELIQQYALGENLEDKIAADHLAACEQCSIAAANYRLLFAAVKQEPEPAFDFNVTELVLHKLPLPAANIAKNKAPGNMMMLIAVFFVIVPLYFFRKFFINVAGGVSSASLLIISVAAIMIVVYRSMDMYKKYQKQLDKLNFH